VGMCRVKMKLPLQPTGQMKTSTVAEKDLFFNQLRETTNEYRGNVMTMKDLNGRVGSNHVGYEEVVGKYGESTKLDTEEIKPQQITGYGDRGQNPKGSSKKRHHPQLCRSEAPIGEGGAKPAKMVRAPD
ncbi:hypothetical protein ILUMI_09433, partial [Ignelater luminosus]